MVKGVAAAGKGAASSRDTTPSKRPASSASAASLASTKAAKSSSRDSTPSRQGGSAKGKRDTTPTKKTPLSASAGASSRGSRKSPSPAKDKGKPEEAKAAAPAKTVEKKKVELWDKQWLTKDEIHGVGKLLLDAIVGNNEKVYSKIVGMEKMFPEIMNFSGNDGNTPLLMACQKGRNIADDLVNALLKQRAHIDFNRQNKQGWTALMWAARKGFGDIVKKLLENKADFDIVCNDKKSALDYTADAECQTLIRKAIADRDKELRRQAEIRLATQIVGYIESGNLASAKALLEDGNMHLINWRKDDKALTPVAVAIKNYDLEAATYLLENGADSVSLDFGKRSNLARVVTMPRMGSYPTTKASRDREARRQQLFHLVYGSNPEQATMPDGQGLTPLMHAAVNAYEEDLRFFIAAGVDVNERQLSYYPYRGTPAQRRQNGDPALVMAVRRGLLGSVRILVEEGRADPNLYGEQRMTPFMWATWLGNLELMGYLICAGADVNAQAEYGETALFWAVHHKDLRTATALLTYRTDPHNELASFGDRYREVRFPSPKQPKKKVAAGGGKGRGKGTARKGVGASLLGMLSKNGSEAAEPEDEEVLLEQRRTVRPDVCCKNKATPLVAACRLCTVLDTDDLIAFIKLIVSCGADVNVITTDKLTPLLWGVMNQNLLITKTLLELHANPLLKNSNGFVPADIAQSLTLQQLLKDYAVKHVQAQKAQ